MFGFSCPVCGEFLLKENKSYKCSNNHCFDIAKQGYVNLLQSQQSKLKRHGDDKLMIKSRTDFLNKGYYTPFLNAICNALTKNTGINAKILDAGCGDCYYTAEIEKALLDKSAEIIGVDISKDALIAASKRSKSIKLAVASVFSLPVADKSCDAVLNIFSPFAPDEYKRVLKQNGILIRAVPLENHLFELKSSIYDKPYKNPTEDINMEGFQIISNQSVKYKISVDNNEDLENLFRMTPYYYKTSESDQKKLESINKLDISCEFSVITYKLSK